MLIFDTTPLSVFLRAGQQNLLASLLDEFREARIHVPEAVANELDRGQRKVGLWRSLLPMVQVHRVGPSPLLTLLLEELHRGEAECIALAIANNAKLVVDEVHGREAARRLGVSITGSVGLVLVARRRGLVQKAKPLVDDLRARGGLWLSDELYREVLASVGEG